MRTVEGKIFVKEEDLRLLFGRIKGIIDEYNIVYKGADISISTCHFDEEKPDRYSLTIRIGESVMDYTSPLFARLEEVAE